MRRNCHLLISQISPSNVGYGVLGIAALRLSLSEAIRLQAEQAQEALLQRPEGAHTGVSRIAGKILKAHTAAKLQFTKTILTGSLWSP